MVRCNQAGEDRTSGSEAEETSLLEVVARERLEKAWRLAIVL
jgi:hypothetical protein